MKKEQREAYEVAKMMKRLEYEGYPSIVMNSEGSYCVIMNKPEFKRHGDETTNYSIEITTLEEEWFDSIYEAVKYQYFAVVRDEPNTTQFNIDLDDDLIDKLYDLADERGVIVDEIIIEVLSEMLDKLSESKCSCQTKCPACGCSHR